ncbi:MAG: phenylacetate-CoA oxygenase subunit PaaJ [Alphaproteobacteria bacterium]|nr:phenylacetate-CoA oxygenase subunit PaaJ [Alphaproteobacteria bacterium]
MVIASLPSVAQVWDCLDTIADPEIPVITLVDLGIIRDVKWQQDQLVITITPTYSGCPATRVINEDIVSALNHKGVKNLRLERRLSPAWTTDWMSEKGRIALEDYGIAPPEAKGTPARCPQCGGDDLERTSQFGSTPCKALWRCKSCLEPFDYFKCI